MFSASSDPPPAPVVEARDLVVQLGDTTVIGGATVAIPRGRITALVGANGSGKSTILRTLARLIRPRHGHVLLDGRDLHRLPTREVARRLAMLPQSPASPPALTVEELVTFGRHPHQGLLRAPTEEDRDAVRWALEVTALTKHAQRQVDSLSGGERQRAWIAMALAQRTEVLLLDEPTTYLDIRYQLEVLTLVRRLNREHGITVVWVLHDLNQAAHHSDHVLMLREGRVVAAGPPVDVMSPDLVHRVFDVHVTIIPHPDTGAPTCLPLDTSRPFDESRPPREVVMP